MGSCGSRKVEPVPVVAPQQEHARPRRSSFQKISESASQIRRKFSFSQTPLILSADLLSLGDFASSYTMSDQVLGVGTYGTVRLCTRCKNASAPAPPIARARPFPPVRRPSSARARPFLPARRAPRLTRAHPLSQEGREHAIRREGPIQNGRQGEAPFGRSEHPAARRAASEHHHDARCMGDAHQRDDRCACSRAARALRHGAGGGGRGVPRAPRGPGEP